MLMTELLHIQFHRQFLITFYGIWLVSILLQLFDIPSQKKNEKEKNTSFLIKSENKMLRKYT